MNPDIEKPLIMGGQAHEGWQEYIKKTFGKGSGLAEAYPSHVPPPSFGFEPYKITPEK